MYITNHTNLDYGHCKFAVRYTGSRYINCKLPLTSVLGSTFAIYTSLLWSTLSTCTLVHVRLLVITTATCMLISFLFDQDVTYHININTLLLDLLLPPITVPQVLSCYQSRQNGEVSHPELCQGHWQVVLHDVQSCVCILRKTQITLSLVDIQNLSRWCRWRSLILHKMGFYGLHCQILLILLLVIWSLMITAGVQDARRKSLLE